MAWPSWARQEVAATCELACLTDVAWVNSIMGLVLRWNIWWQIIWWSWNICMWVVGCSWFVGCIQAVGCKQVMYMVIETNMTLVLL